MKKLIIISIIALFTSLVNNATAENYPDEYLGLPGDNLNLYATMELFQESETLEGFERSLNDRNSNINNLDLNGDNLIDYISVMDYVDGSVHTIVLRTALNRNETQDIAVFAVQQFDDGSARLQLIGDEALYGKNYIVEPIYSDSRETPNPGYIGNTRVVTSPKVIAVTTYEVAAWPIIRFIYRPSYICWRSSWTWGYYPSYWNPWRPYYWHTYYGYHSHFHNHYYAHYRHWNHYRYNRYHDFYYGHVRTYSPKISSRIREGNYKTTYSRPDLRKRGDELYNRSARRSTETGIIKSGTRTSSNQTLRNRTNNDINSSSGRRIVSNKSTQTRVNSTINNRTGDTRKSSTVRSASTTTKPSQTSRKAVSQRTETRSSSPYRSGSVSSTNKKREIQPKSTTVRNNRTSRSSSVSQKSSQPKRSTSTYSKKSASSPKVSSRSSSSRSSSRQPKVSSKSSSSNSRSSKATSKSSQSRSSSNGRSGRR
ncbi:hypothetical protein ACUNWD_11075 [Sunxiuqinia sp. A32]|uniref:hypothetical protein n=1 Tax=Sunxiuqinia sp. A32 TaxID=3461496 RepID=UPI004045379D